MSLTAQQLSQLSGSCTVLASIRQEDDEAAWLAARTRGIGGSDVGAICGVNQWSSALQIYFRKTGQFEDEPSGASQERMHWGHMLEPVVADEFERQHDEFTLREADCTFKSTQYPFLLANVDRFVIDKSTDKIVGILECKTANDMMNTEWAAGEVPISYLYQVQHYLFVTGLNRAWISCLVGGNKFYTYDIFFDSQLYTSTILPVLDNFWNNCVIKLQEPEVQSADGEMFNNLFPAEEVDDEPVDLSDPSFDILGDEIEALKAEKKKIETQIDEKLAKIKQVLQTHKRGYSLSYEFSWTPRTRTGVDSTKLQAEYPEVYDNVLKTTHYRQMSIKKVIDDD